MSRSLSSPHYAILLDAVVAARKAADLKQADLAERLGKHQSFVSKYERGERRLDLIELIVVARAMGVDEAKLVREIADQLPVNARL